MVAPKAGFLNPVGRKVNAPFGIADSSSTPFETKMISNVVWTTFIGIQKNTNLYIVSTIGNGPAFIATSKLAITIWSGVERIPLMASSIQNSEVGS